MSADASARPRLARAAEGRPRRGTPAGTRERLVAAAAEVLNRDGYFGTDSNAIARAPATAGDVLQALRGQTRDPPRRLRALGGRRVAHIAGVLRAGAPRRGETARDPTRWILGHHRRWRPRASSSLRGSGAIRWCARSVAQRRDSWSGWRLRATACPAAADREADALLLFAFERLRRPRRRRGRAAGALDAARLELLLVEQLAARLGAVTRRARRAKRRAACACTASPSPPPCCWRPARRASRHAHRPARRPSSSPWAPRQRLRRPRARREPARRRRADRRASPARRPGPARRWFRSAIASNRTSTPATT
ncbi:MAG: hypothetical protein U0802_16300 [Candidatus Binatia bacterium]